MSVWTKRLAAMAGVLAWMVLVVGGAQAAQFVTVASGGTAGVYYPLAGAMAEIFNQHVPGVNASVQATGASVANVNLLAQGQAELAFIQNDIAYYAVNGVEMFQGRKVTNLRGVATLYPEVIQLVALRQAGIGSVADLKGKRVAVGDIGSGTEANARQILEAAGLSYRDMAVRYLSFAEAAANLRDGHIDAAFVTAGIPTSAIQDIAVQKDIVIVPIAGPLVERLKERYPFYTQVTIPAGTYRGQSSPVTTVAVKAMLVARADLPEDLVYNLTRALFNNLGRLAQAHVRGQDVSIETARDGMSIPLHPGAARFYQEASR